MSLIIEYDNVSAWVTSCNLNSVSIMAKYYILSDLFGGLNKTAREEEMRSIEIILSIINLSAFLLLLIPNSSARSCLRIVIPIIPVTACAQLLFEGSRWQMLPAYMVSAVLCLLWLYRLIACRKGVQALPFFHGPVMVIAATGVMRSLLLPVIMPVFTFSQPSGPFGIGTLTCHWVDKQRREVFSADPNDRRELIAQIWYPTSKGIPGPSAPYLQDAGIIAAKLAELLHLPKFTLSHFIYITTNAKPSIPIAATEPSYPVLVFLEGLTGYRQMNNYQVEELVSHGYIVVAIDQPYIAAETVFPDGRKVTGLSKEQMNMLIQQSITPLETTPILNGQPFPQGIIPYFAQDVLFTLNQLATINQNDSPGIINGRMNLQHVGVFGVSLGGIVASEAALLEPRLKACLVMDAPMPANVVANGLQQPGMWITRDAETMRRERSRSGGWSEEEIAQHQTTMRAVFEKLPANKYFVQIAGAFHVNFMDITYWSPLTSTLGISGPIDGQRAYRIINAYSLAFFDKYLKGNSASLLELPAKQYPEVTFEGP